MNEPQAQPPKRKFTGFLRIAILVLLAVTLYGAIFGEAPEKAEPAPEAAATAALTGSVQLPAFQAEVVDRMPGMKLSIDCTIQEPVDEATLRALGEKVYREHKGGDYQRVFIMWYLPGDTKGAGAWGTTNFEGGKIQVRVMRM